MVEEADDRFAIRNLRGDGVEAHALGELEIRGATSAGGADAGAFASFIDGDGVAIGEEGSLDKADGFSLVHALGDDEGDGRAFENGGVLDEGHAGKVLIEAEQVRDDAVLEIDGVTFVRDFVDSRGLGLTAAHTGSA